MKREICCELCINGWKKIEKELVHTPDEHIIIKKGILKISGRCDGCGDDLIKGESVYTMSLYTDRIPYFEWEHEYITWENNNG